MFKVSCHTVITYELTCNIKGNSEFSLVIVMAVMKTSVSPFSYEGVKKSPCISVVDLPFNGDGICEYNTSCSCGETKRQVDKTVKCCPALGVREMSSSNSINTKQDE